MISPQSFPWHLGVKYLQIANTVKLRQRPTGNREGVKGEQTGCLQLSTKATTWLQIIPKVVSRYLVISNETWIYIVQNLQTNIVKNSLLILFVIWRNKDVALDYSDLVVQGSWLIEQMENRGWHLTISIIQRGVWSSRIGFGGFR